MKERFRPDRHTSVLLVKAFKEGRPSRSLRYTGHAATARGGQRCVRGQAPGRTGPSGAAECALDLGRHRHRGLAAGAANWNKRIHVIGGGGWAGGVHTPMTLLAGSRRGQGPPPRPSLIPTIEGAVSATTDTGHTAPGSGSFAMNPDGTHQHGAVERLLAARHPRVGGEDQGALTKAYYGTPARYAYWDGFSTGGRQGHKLAQLHPGGLRRHPRPAHRHSTGRASSPTSCIRRSSISAISAACRSPRDNSTCSAMPPSTPATWSADSTSATSRTRRNAATTRRATPTSCARPAAASTRAPNCVSNVQAQAMNKLWYGQTRDGPCASPAVDNSWALHTLDCGNHLWYGLTRGTQLRRAGR